MSDNLVNNTLVASMWLRSNGPSPAQTFDSATKSCSGGGNTWQLPCIVTYHNSICITPSFLGVDAATGLGYFSFTLNTEAWIFNKTTMLSTFTKCETPPTDAFVILIPTAIQSTNLVATTIVGQVNGVGGTKSTWDNHFIIPCSGFPVVCCVLAKTVGGANSWYGLNTGIAVANTLASAIAACGITGWTGPPCVDVCDEIDVTIIGLS